MFRKFKPRSESTITKLDETRTVYMNEIMSDFQTRMKVTSKESNIPDVLPSHIGMQTINPTSWQGKHFTEFANSSTIHGLNHLVAPHRHPVEKVLAVLVITVAFVALIALSLIFWNRYQYEATVTILDHEYQTFGVVKPSIIFCPVEAVNTTVFPEVFKRYDVKDTPEARNFFTFLSNASYPEMQKIPDYEGAPPDKWMRILYDLRHQMSITYKDTDPNVWEDVWVITEKGVCQTKRNFVSVYATMDYWLADNWTIVPLPDTLPSFTYDKDRGSSESITSIANILRGFIAPVEVLEYRDIERMEMVLKRWVQRETLKIIETVSEETLHNLAVHQRNCKFNEDGGLKMWPIYTYGMCKIECRYGIIKDLCGCHPHFARPVPGVPVCNVEQLRCVGSITHSLFLHALPPAHCKCIPNCNTVVYVKEDFISKYFAESLLKIDVSKCVVGLIRLRLFETLFRKLGSPINSSAVSILISFPKLKFRRIEQYGFIDFLTAVGGAAGLFLGASVLSFIEIFYYGTIRLIVYKLRSRKENKSGKSKASPIARQFPKEFDFERNVSGDYIKDNVYSKTNWVSPRWSNVK